MAMKTIQTILLFTASLSFAQDFTFPNLLYTEDGCSKEYFEKARRLNQIMGAGAGVASIGASIAGAPLSFFLVTGGIASVGNSALELAREKLPEEHRTNLNMRSSRSAKPRVRFPIAINFYDMMNTLEYMKLRTASPNSVTASYIDSYIRANAIAGLSKDDMKSCKKAAKEKGLKNSEIKAVNSNFLTFLDTTLPEDPNKNLSPITRIQQEYAGCVLAIQSTLDDSYPYADLILIEKELSGQGLLDWKLNGVARMYEYTFEKAQKAGKDISTAQYFEALRSLDHTYGFCEKPRKPLNRKKVASRILQVLNP